MSREKKNIVQVVILLVILVIVIVFAIKVLNKNDKKENKSGKSTGVSAVNPDDPAYQNMTIYEKDGDIIIEGQDGSKTIETNKTKEDTGLVETTEEEREKYEITNVSVTARGDSTIITGKVKNNDSKKHKVVVKIKFYGEDNKIKGATSAKLELNKRRE